MSTRDLQPARALCRPVCRYRGRSLGAEAQYLATPAATSGDFDGAEYRFPRAAAARRRP